MCDVAILAFDLGSSSVRATVLDEQLHPLPGAVSRRRVALRQDATGAAELDADRYVEAVCECLDDLSAAGHLAGVHTAAASSQWHSLVPLDEHDRPAGPGLSWMDLRAQAVRVGPHDDEAFHRRTGTWWHPFYWPVKIGWLVGRGVRARRWIGLPEYLTLRLLGELGVSVSSASGTGVLDTRTCRWDAEALDLAGVTEDMLPPLVPDDWRGRLTPQFARRWPDLAQTRWAAPIGDGAASAVGSGCWGPDRLSVTVGTSAAVRLVTPGAPDPAPSIWRYRVDSQRSVLGAAFSAGGALYEWVSRLVGDQEASEAALSRLRPGEHGVVCLPYHAGHRPPLPLTDVGTLHGLKLSTGPTEVVAATLEGVCHEISGAARSLAPSAQVTPVLGGGAVAASAWFTRRLTAALGGTALRCLDAEVGARGAAALATGIDSPPRLEEVTVPEREVAAMATAAQRHWAVRDRIISLQGERSWD